MTAPASPDVVAEWVHRTLDLERPPELRPIGTGKFNTSFEASEGGSSWIVRIAPHPSSVFLFYERDMMRQEPELHRILRERTSAPVPRILAFDDSRKRLPSDGLIMEQMPGRPLSAVSGADVHSVFHDVGRCLWEVHAITRENYGYLGAHRPMDPQRSWPEAFFDMWRRLLNDIVDVGHYAPTDRDRLARLLDRHLHRFDRGVPASLLHMDVWHENILVDAAGSLTGLIDWDRALWGDPEIEFAVLDYCGVSVPSFWDGYGQPRDDSPDAEIRRIFYLLYEIQKYIVIREGRSRDSAAARAYRDQALAIASRLPEG